MVMDKDFLKGIKGGFGFIFVIALITSVFAIGFHLADEVLPGVFQGDFTFNGSIDMSGNRIEGVGLPVGPNDVPNRAYVDALVGGISPLGIPISLNALVSDFSIYDTAYNRYYYRTSVISSDGNLLSVFDSPQIGSTYFGSEAQMYVYLIDESGQIAYSVPGHSDFRKGNDYQKVFTLSNGKVFVLSKFYDWTTVNFNIYYADVLNSDLSSFSGPIALSQWNPYSGSTVKETVYDATEYGGDIYVLIYNLVGGSCYLEKYSENLVQDSAYGSVSLPNTACTGGGFSVDANRYLFGNILFDFSTSTYTTLSVSGRIGMIWDNHILRNNGDIYDLSGSYVDTIGDIIPSGISQVYDLGTRQSLILSNGRVYILDNKIVLKDNIVSPTFEGKIRVNNLLYNGTNFFTVAKTTDSISSATNLYFNTYDLTGNILS